MAVEFPELTTIGALFVFARRLEQTAAELLGRLAEAEGEGSPAARLAVKHARRADELERARKEKLNETVLEPLTALDGSPFVPEVPGPGAGADELRAAAVALERRAAAFYDFAVDKAGPVLAEMRRQLARMARDSEKHAAALSGS